MVQHYGAAIAKKQYIRCAAAAGVGSILEWYDYTVLIALSPVVTKVFFPPGQPAALQQLSFWSVYAVGFIFRPLGSLLFGHICDAHGRRLSLLITLMMMAVPTVLIGCLPSYHQAGVAAPVLLSLLRLVQGIAVGGELGTAVVFMHELAPANKKSKGGSLIFIGVTAGILMGIIVAMIVNAAIPPAALEVWGWRIPFLIAALTAAVGLSLRFNMPESYEFEQDAVKAAYRAHLQRTQPQPTGLLQQEQKLLSCSTPAAAAADALTAIKGTAAAAAAAKSNAAINGNSHSGNSHSGNSFNNIPDKGLNGHVAIHMQSSQDTASSTDGHMTTIPARPAPLRSLQQQQHQKQQDQEQCIPVGPVHSSCCSCGACSWMLGHDPVRMCFRDHWREVLLLFWFETWSAANFYVFYGWLPSYIATHWNVRVELTLGMTLVNMSFTLGLIPAAAHLSDKGVPRLAATAVMLSFAAAASIPMLLAVGTQSMVAAWLMQLTDLVLNATIFGWLPTIGSLLFPVHVRATGYNFAHTAAQSWLGGLTPVIISAIQAAVNSVYLVTGVYLTVCAMISLVVLVIMWRKHPQTNRTPPAQAVATSLDSSITSVLQVSAVDKQQQ